MRRWASARTRSIESEASRGPGYHLSMSLRRGQQQSIERRHGRHLTASLKASRERFELFARRSVIAIETQAYLVLVDRPRVLPSSGIESRKLQPELRVLEIVSCQLLGLAQ